MMICAARRNSHRNGNWRRPIWPASRCVKDDLVLGGAR
jgi:hypothetical protein